MSAEKPSPNTSDAVGFQHNDVVEVFGLESATGQALNGRRGKILRLIEEKSRWDVFLEAPDAKLVSVKAQNLRKVEVSHNGFPKASKSASSSSSSSSSSSESEASEEPLQVGELVQIHGLGSKNNDNGKTGVVVKVDAKDCEVYVIGNHLATVKMGNLRRTDLTSVANPESSAPTARDKAAKSTGPKIGARVEICELRSEAGAQLNGKQGVVLKSENSKGRCEVSLGPDESISVRPDNLKVLAEESAPAQEPKKVVEKPASSLAGLLGLGRADEKEEEEKPGGWQSVWSRSADDSAPIGSATMASDQVDIINAVANKNCEKDARRALRKTSLVLKAAAELAISGITGQDLLQLMEENLRQLDDADVARSPSRSRSRSPRRPFRGGDSALS